MEPTRETTRRGVDGYAMAAMLVAIAVLGIVMSVLMPTWRHMVQREKEAELIFRGEQYVHAISLYQRKFAGAYPADFDTLVKQKFLRRKYKDPMSEDGEFEPVFFGQQMQLQRGGQTGQRGQPAGTSGQRGATGSSGSSSSSSSSTSFSFDSRSGTTSMSTRAGGVIGARGGMVGVRSKSTDESIREYKGRTHYSEWEFVWMPNQMGRPGMNRPGMMPGIGGPGQVTPGLSQPGMGGRGGRGFNSGQGGEGPPPRAPNPSSF
jgi:type II secretory pathway pseudopilin PulG